MIQAQLVAPRQFAFVELPQPRPEPGQVLLEIGSVAATIRTTDRSNLDMIRSGGIHASGGGPMAWFLRVDTAGMQLDRAVVTQQCPRGRCATSAWRSCRARLAGSAGSHPFTE